MLGKWIRDPVQLAFAQAALAALAALAVAKFAESRRIALMRDAGWALARGLVQIVVVGLALAALMRGPRWTGPILLAAMVAAAAQNSVRRLGGVPAAFRISLLAILLGAGSVISFMVLAGLVETSIAALIPVGSMLIANAMNGNSLALERLRADVTAHTGEIEAALALGAAPEATMAPYTRSALLASLTPPINNLSSLGIVWIPGLMAGMVLTGASPLSASIYQFVVLAMILAAAGLTSVVGIGMLAKRAFSAAEQLVMRGEAGEGSPGKR